MYDAFFQHPILRSLIVVCIAQTAAGKRKLVLDEKIEKARRFSATHVAPQHKKAIEEDAILAKHQMLMQQEAAAQIHAKHLEHQKAMALAASKDSKEKLVELKYQQLQETEKLLDEISERLHNAKVRHAQWNVNVQVKAHRHNAYVGKLVERMKKAQDAETAKKKKELEEKQAGAAKRKAQVIDKRRVLSRRMSAGQLLTPSSTPSMPVIANGPANAAVA